MTAVRTVRWRGPDTDTPVMNLVRIMLVTVCAVALLAWMWTASELFTVLTSAGFSSVGRALVPAMRVREA